MLAAALAVFPCFFVVASPRSRGFQPARSCPSILWLVVVARSSKAGARVIMQQDHKRARRPLDLWSNVSPKTDTAACGLLVHATNESRFSFLPFFHLALTAYAWRCFFSPIDVSRRTSTRHRCRLAAREPECQLIPAARVLVAKAAPAPRRPRSPRWPSLVFFQKCFLSFSSSVATASRRTFIRRHCRLAAYRHRRQLTSAARVIEATARRVLRAPWRFSLCTRRSTDPPLGKYPQLDRVPASTCGVAQTTTHLPVLLQLLKFPRCLHNPALAQHLHTVLQL